jgi:hypothetical protein
LGLLTVFYAPEKLFAEVGETGKWVLPFVASLLIAALISIATTNMIDMSAYVRAELESNRLASQYLTQQQIDQAARDAASPGAKMRGYIMAPVITGVVLLIMAGVLLGLSMIVDAGTSFKKVLSVCAYSGFAYSVVGGLGGIVALKMMGDTSTADLYNLVKLNPTLFMDQATASKPLYSLASSLDLLSFWRIFLIGLGLSKVSKKLSLGKGLGLAIVPWAAYVLGKMGWAAIF